MLILAYSYASAVLVFFYIVVCCKISKLIDTIIQDDVSGCVICTLNKFEYLDKEELQKFYQRSYMVNLSDI